MVADGRRRLLLTYALSNSLRAMIFVLSFISAPGPEATHSSSVPHDGPGMSHGLPDFWHLGPLTFGVASPKLDEANAATNGPCAHNKHLRPRSRNGREGVFVQMTIAIGTIEGTLDVFVNEKNTYDIRSGSAYREKKMN